MKGDNMSYICEGGEEKRIAEMVHELFGRKLGSFSGGFNIDFERSPFTITFEFRSAKKPIAGFTLTQMINCCGILVSTKTFVEKSHQGHGIAQEMMSLKEALAKEFGYSSMLATVNVSGNPAEVHILEKNGWTCNNTFVNSRTKNTVGVFTKNL
jgi:GNAT superfamily N-acetyltransferase